MEEKNSQSKMIYWFGNNRKLERKLKGNRLLRAIP